MAEAKHEYPSNYGPEHGGDLAIAWKILDSIKPGIISTEIRAYLCGQIVAALHNKRRNHESNPD